MRAFVIQMKAMGVILLPLIVPTSIFAGTLFDLLTAEQNIGPELSEHPALR